MKAFQNVANNIHANAGGNSSTTCDSFLSDRNKFFTLPPLHVLKGSIQVGNIFLLFIIITVISITINIVIIICYCVRNLGSSTDRYALPKKQDSKTLIDKIFIFYALRAVLWPPVGILRADRNWPCGLIYMKKNVEILGAERNPKWMVDKLGPVA